MNNIFDFKRFGKYYVSDLKHAFDYSALTILLTSLSGIIAYLFCGIMKLIVSGEWMSYGTAGRCATFVIAFYIIAFSVPAKCYGHFTDKRSGSFFTLIPASSLEKTLSMIINVCILAPISYLVISLAADSLLCLLDPRAGESLIHSVTTASGEFANAFARVNSAVDFDLINTSELVGGYILNVSSWIMVFLIGALYFKKNKVGKTFLVTIAVSMVLGTLSTWILMPLANSGLIETLNNAENVQHAFRMFKFSTISVALIEIVGLMIWTYVRVRTVKH
ncbi:MAG: hypothetical protein ACI39U_02855 [Candidatus Cryptobacteroides sp.]